MSNSQEMFRVAALYRFSPVADPAVLKRSLAAFCKARGVKGTLILAPEGINGTVAGEAEAIGDLVATLRALPGFEPLDVKLSTTSTQPFHRLKVRLKPEIVTMGVAGIDPIRHAGSYVDPADWDALIVDPDTVVVDTRNRYEVALGSFKGAIDPGTDSFRSFPAWADANRERFDGRKVAMFCTGGIRCEKATAYLRSLGVEQVFHLRGGILRYLEEAPADASPWQGECFVFDERVAVGHGLKQGSAMLCRACRRPLTVADRADPLYIEGQSCPRCHSSRSEADRARYAERHRQVALAAATGRRHIGG
ncbi:MAG: rhodanese-related sulfurtransferase [Rhizobiaceae bacterium]